MTCSRCKRPAKPGPGEIDSTTDCRCVALMLTGARMVIVDGKPEPVWHNARLQRFYEEDAR